jgi:hypothetical protein
MISTTQYEYQSVLEWCAAVASDENPSPASYQLIEQACSELISAN